MAGGKASARQKMINLMYLVFIAMLALNMGKQVLSSFGYLNEKLEDSHVSDSNDIEAIIRGLHQKASDQPDKYGGLDVKATKINELSNEFFAYLGGVKEALLASTDPELHRDYESLDKEAPGNEFFFLGEKKLSPQGEEFVNRINNYRDQVIEILGEKATPTIKKTMDKRFQTKDVPMKGGGEQPWIRNRYEGFPLIATLTNISVIQSDIKLSEKEIYNSLLGKQLEADAGINATNYQAIVLPVKSTFYSDEYFEGKIVLGKYDASLKPESLTINGRKYTERDKDGAAIVKFKTGKVGDNPIIGEFIFKQDGKPVKIPVKNSYTVVPKPNEAVVSADKMNVVYRGIDNPITISMPGIADNNINANATGLKKIKGTHYMLKPGKGKTVEINVTGKTNDGTVIKSPAVSFRIKDLPPAASTIRKQFGSIKLPKSSLAKSTIEAGLIDFDFDLKLRVASFKIKIPGQSTITVKGNRFDARAQKAILKAKRGDVISIFDMKSSIIGNSSLKLKKPLPLSVEISN